MSEKDIGYLQLQIRDLKEKNEKLETKYDELNLVIENKERKMEGILDNAIKQLANRNELKVALNEESMQRLASELKMILIEEVISRARKTMGRSLAVEGQQQYRELQKSINEQFDTLNTSMFSFSKHMHKHLSSLVEKNKLIPDSCDIDDDEKINIKSKL